MWVRDRVMCGILGSRAKYIRAFMHSVGTLWENYFDIKIGVDLMHI